MSFALGHRSHRWIVASILALFAGAAVVWAQRAHVDEGPPAPAELSNQASVRLWDTVAPLQSQIGLTRRERWRAVTAGAPGRLQGDLVVETNTLAAAFPSRLGKVVVCALGEPTRSRVELVPSELRGKQTILESTKITRPSAGVVMVHAGFAAPEAKSLPIAFSFTGNRILAVTPEGGTRGISVIAPIDLALVPSFVGDDLIYDPRDYPSAKALSVPSEHLLLGLLKGERSMFIVTWQDDRPPVNLALSDPGGNASIQAADFMGGGGLSLAVLNARGIWHWEPLKPSYLERDVAIQWKPPYPAIWLTQLYEDEVKTTFEFRDAREEVWRGGVGSYIFPTWFSGGKTMLSLGKSIPPEGEAIIYFLERSDATPEQALSPIDVVKATLTGDVLDRILDVEARPSWYPQRADPVLGGATCGVTDQLKKIFDEGQEVEKQAIVKGGVEDMYFYLEGMFRLDARYYPFAKDMLAYLEAQEKQQPSLAPYSREMRGIAEEIITTYDNSRDTIRDMSYAHELGDKTIALAAEHRPDNAQRMVELKQDWTGMGGALEELARKEHTLTRKLFQQAAYRAATRPEAMAVAEEIRRRARQCMEKPGSYEIWANY
jgi:hypothetical protein